MHTTFPKYLFGYLSLTDEEIDDGEIQTLPAEWKSILDGSAACKVEGGDLPSAETEQSEQGCADSDKVSMILQEDTGTWVVLESSAVQLPVKNESEISTGKDTKEDTIVVMAPVIANEIQKTDQNSKQDPKEKEDSLANSVAPIADSGNVKEGYLPVFNTEEEHLDFENYIQQSVDYTEVDKLYERFKFEQAVIDTEMLQSSEMTKYKELFVFNCRVCKKVFNSLKNIRVHCFTHTQIKPFKCPQEGCDYSCNSKSNLLSHMRKHTGNMYLCTLCEFKSLSKAALDIHMQQHDNRELKCKLCKDDSTVYKDESTLQGHIATHHMNAEGRQYLHSLSVKPKPVQHSRRGRKSKNRGMMHQCDVCLYRSKSKSDITRHQAVHKIKNISSMSCELCDFVSARAEYLLKHYKTHRILYLCCVCHCKILSATRLLEHLRDHETDEQELNTLYVNSINSSIYLPEPDGSIATFQCGVGGKVIGLESGGVLEELNSENAEANHPLLNEESIYSVCKYKPLTVDVFNKIQETFGDIECEYCGRRFHRQGDYSEHVNVHTREKVYDCEYEGCDFQALSKDNLRRHTEKVHELKKYKCDVCDHTSDSRMKAWHHKQDMHEGNIDVVCPGCNTRFTKARKLRAHIARVHPNLDRDLVVELTGQQIKIHGKLGRRSFKCQYCRKLFVNAHDLEKHTWIHEGIRPYKCDKCNYSCRSSNNLKTHQLKHSKEKTQLCEECGKKYKSATALSWHIKSHEQGRIFKCDKCDYTAVQKSHLKRHMETHSGVRRFRCSECDYTTNTIASMKVHYSRAHKGMAYTTPILNQSELPANQKVYKCGSCDFLFCNLSDLKRHLNTRHQGPWLPNLSDLHLQEIMTPDGSTSLVQVVEIQPSEEVLEVTDIPGEEHAQMDETTASAVTILQQIIEQSNQQQVEIQPVVQEGTAGVIVNAEGGETIILQESEEVVIGEDMEQYIITYVNEDGTVLHTEVPASEIPQ